MQNPFSVHEPNTLFTLPQPIDRSSGQIHPGQVFGIHGSRKRKRSEVVIGIDGECINVYNVKSPQLVTTHALAPQTYLTAPPSCTLNRSSNQRSSHRFIYAATRNGLAGRSPELLCFSESQDATSSTHPRRYTRDIRAQSSDIVHIEPINAISSSESSETGSHQVLAVHSNGNITIFSDDLLHERGYGTVESQHPNEAERKVELVKLQTSTAAKKALLSRRPDLTARLEETDTILLVVTAPVSSKPSEKHKKTCHVLSVQPSRLGTTANTAIQTLVSWSLSLETIKNEYSQLVYHDESACLYHLNQDNIAVWDLKTPMPRITSKFRIHPSQKQTVVPVSETTILVCSSTDCILYDSMYGALHAIQRHDLSNVTSSSKKKRKRSDLSSQSHQVIPIEYFPEISAVICLAGSDLISIGISVSTKDLRRHKEGRLIDSLGRAQAMIGSDDVQSRTNHIDDDDLTKAYGKLKQNLSEDRLEEFDNIFLDFVATKSQYAKRSLSLRIMSLLFEWSAGTPSDPYFPKARASSVRLKSTPRRSMAWMAENGLLTPQNVSKAAVAGAYQGHGSVNGLSEREMVVALAQADQSLNFLADLLQVVKLGISGYMESLRLLMDSFHAAPSQEQTAPLENGHDSEMTNGVTEQQLLLEESAAAEELQLAAALLEGGSDGRGSALKTCIERLGTNFSSSELVQTLRHQLSQREIFMLVEILRIELDQAGWTSRRLDFHPSQDSTENQNEAIAVICKLLNCALDAIGTGGWLSRNGSSEEEDVDSLIALLRTDTNAVLEGVQEATFFGSFLKDFIRYEETLNEAVAKKGRMKWSSNDPPQLSRSMLPLGLKSAQKPASTRVGAGGEIQKRSAREKAMESSQKIGRYKFETIRI